MACKVIVKRIEKCWKEDYRSGGYYNKILKLCICSECNTHVASDSIFCSHCGIKFDADPVDSVHNDLSEKIHKLKTKRKKLLEDICESNYNSIQSAVAKIDSELKAVKSEMNQWKEKDFNSALY